MESRTRDNILNNSHIFRFVLVYVVTVNSQALLSPILHLVQDIEFWNFANLNKYQLKSEQLNVNLRIVFFYKKDNHSLT
jgi:hypothetical protein